MFSFHWMEKGAESNSLVNSWELWSCPIDGSGKITVKSGLQDNSVGLPANHFQAVLSVLRKHPALLALALMMMVPAALAVSEFSPQVRLGYHTGDQWEPAMAADAHGHVYVLYPQYGAVPDCPSCTAPSIALLVSDDNGAAGVPSRALLPFSTGQFDPQIVVDPLDRQTVYASWMQNEKRDIIVARSL